MYLTFPAYFENRSRDPELFNSERKKKWNEIIWNDAESLLKGSAGDVLIIFDCCAAGNLGRDIGVRGRGAHRAFEFLGATSAEYTTPEPGPNSFTSGLIWALEQLATEEEFTTSELLRKITDHPRFPQDQYPVLCERDKPSLKKICISPLAKDASCQKARVAKESSAPVECLEFLDLRVLLTRHPNDDDITKIARTLKDMLKRNSMEVVRHIGWERLSAFQGSTGRFPNLVQVVSFSKRWRRKTGQKSPIPDALCAKEDLNGKQSPREPSDASQNDSEASRKRRR